MSPRISQPILLLFEACSYAPSQKPFTCFPRYRKSADVQSVFRLQHVPCLLKNADATQKLAFAIIYLSLTHASKF
ncbi:UNVERIFIED_CONTAM: hypothetical protein NCL1_03150 [Trichonephila clavipes]